MKKYILWDLDGTILNTNDIIMDSWQAASVHVTGEKLDENVIMKTFGETIRFTVNKFWPDADADDTIAYYRKYQNDNLEGRVSLFEGVPELLAKLKEQGYSLSIVTSRTGATAMDYIERFDIGDFFDVIITCEDVDVHKPDPEPINRCLAKLVDVLGHEIPREECIMIGDTRFDVGCAKNAHVDSALVGWSHPIDEDELRELGLEPDYRFDKPMDVVTVLAEQ